MKFGAIKIAFIVFLIFFSVVTFAQEQLPMNHPGCTTGDNDKTNYLPDADAFLRQQLAARLGDTTYNDFSAPYYVRVFIRIVRENNGTLPGCTVEQAIQNFNEMNGQYNAHNICFQLAGIDFVNDSYLNNFNNSGDVDDVYPAYIRDNNLDVDGAMTIFIHYSYLWNSGSSGNAYGIPNNFLSVARWAATSNTVHSIFGHEMGHCLGLYHTFRRANGVQETVTRNAGNSCYNCPTEGDLCCDTPADYTDSENNTSSSTCNYSGTATNACDGLTYNPSTINIMSYQPWACISFTGTAITTNQRTRMHASINNPLGPIFSRVSEDNVLQLSLTNTSATIRIHAAKNNYSTSAAATITHSGNARAYYVAGNAVTFSPGVTLSPNSSGIIQASISNCN
ncbi:MAG TPA: M43 family zinc metalloprotease [Ferruginibacter sp.]|nr:M43 family zinc metalloprotease [Ferruginibacter sp.]HRE64424.1 M43 family zinc metalloprotease [Ferruginibacter sp.]